MSKEDNIKKVAEKIVELEEQIKEAQEKIKSVIPIVSNSTITIPYGSTVYDYSYPTGSAFNFEYQSGVELEKELGEQYNQFPSEIKNIISDIENIEGTYFISGNEDRIKMAEVIKKHIEVIKFNVKLDKITNE